MNARPYKGLASFDDTELDARLFFGRDRERETIVANLFASRLTVVFGPSGVGKSSLLRAGVAQELRRRHAGTVVVHGSWADRPVEALVDAIRTASPPLGATAGLADTVAACALRTGEVVLLLDQLEEYFAYHEPGGPLADALHELLRRPGLRVSVLLALREDALGQLDAFTGRLPEVFANLLRIEPLGPDAAGDAVVGPLGAYAELTGERVSAEPGLVRALQDEVGAGLEAPFLQLVLDRLWDEERSSGSSELRLSTLERLGGSASVAREHVTGALGRLGAAEQAVVARVVRQLVTPSGAKVALGESDLADYADLSPVELRPLLDTLARERILRAVDRHGGREPRFEIFHDVLAEPLLAWRQSFVVHRARAASRRVAALSLAALLVVAAIAVYALAQRSSARAQARRAHAHELEARALAAVSTDPAGALRLGLQAARLSADAQAADVLRAGLLALRERRILRLGAGTTTASFAGERLLAGGSSGRAAVYDAGGRRLAAFAPQPGLDAAAWSADGLLAATGTRAGTATIFDAHTGRALRTVRTPAPVTALAFDGHTLLVGSGGSLRVVHGAHGTVERVRVGGVVVAAALQPGGRIAAVAWKHGGRVTTQLLDVTRRRAAATLPERGVTVLSFSPDGTLLATGSTDKTTRLWLAAGGRLRRVLPQRGHITGLAFSRDGGTLVTSSDDGTAAVWNVRTGARDLLLAGATGAVQAAAIAPDGSQYAVASADRLGRLYDGTDGRLLAPLAGHAGAVTGIGFDASGRVVVTAGDDGTVRLWDALPSDRFAPSSQRLAGSAPARVVSPAGGVAATRKGRDAFLVDVGTGRVLHVLAGHRSLVTDVSFSPDGRLLVTASVDHDARLWDVRSGRLLHVLRGHFFPVASASFSPDGRWIVTASQFAAGLWDAQTGLLVEYVRGAPGPLADAAFTRGGATILAVTTDGATSVARCVVCHGLSGLEQAARARLAALG